MYHFSAEKIPDPVILLNQRSSYTLKVGVHSYLPNGHLNLWPNFNFEKLVKSETSSCSFSKVAHKGTKNSLERHESWRARLFIEMGT